MSRQSDIPLPRSKRVGETRRVQQRWNVAIELAAWVREEAQRRGVAQGVVVEEALTAAMRRRSVNG